MTRKTIEVVRRDRKPVPCLPLICGVALLIQSIETYLTMIS